MKTSLASGRSALLAVAFACAAALGGCGGGGSDDAGDPAAPTDTSPELARLVSANTAVIPSDATEAVAVTLATAQAVVGAGQMSVTLPCPGGGTAAYAVSGTSLLLLLNGRLDAGEHYSLVFSGCKAEVGGASVTGPMTLDVLSASGSDFAVQTATTQVVVDLPRRTVTLNGSSTLAHTVVTAGSTTTTTDRWITPSYTVITVGGGLPATFSLTQLDLTQSVSVSNGVVVSRSLTGGGTLSVSLPEGSFSITFATQGPVGLDGNGTPTGGSWSITLAHDAISFTIATGMATIVVDHGANGSADQTYTVTVDGLVIDAG